MAGHAQLKFVMTECSKTQSSFKDAIMLNFWLYSVWFNSTQFSYSEANQDDVENVLVKQVVTSVADSRRGLGVCA